MSSTALEFANAAPADRPQSVAASRRTMLDVARLIAAYAIVWLHVPRSAAFARVTSLGRFAVPFFTAAAVFLVWDSLQRNRERTLAAYTRSRFERIYVPFLAWSLIYLAFKAVKAKLLPEQPNDFPGIDFLWLGSFFHLWFMPFILLVTLAAFCAGRSIVGRSTRELIALIGCLLLGWQVAWLPEHYAAETASFHNLAIDALPAALWGVALAIGWPRGNANWLRRPAVSVVALAFTVLLTAAVWTVGRNRLAENLAGLTFLVFALTDWRVTQLDRLARLGSLAYGIYLSHLLFIKVLQAFETKLGIVDTTASLLVVFVLAAAASTCLAWFLSRSQWTRWLLG